MQKPTIRASEMDRVISCPGSLTLVPLVAPREGDDGLEGSLLHFFIAQRAVAELGAIPPEGGLASPVLPPGYKLSPFTAWIVDWAIRHLKDNVPAGWALFVELPLSYEYDRWISSGHHDWFAISPDGAESIGGDWKAVIVAVDPAESNWQVASYLSLEKLAWPTLIKQVFHVCQPRLDPDDGHERVSVVTLSGDETRAMVTTLDAHVCLSLDRPRSLDTGIKSCRFCSAALQCAGLIKHREFMKHELTDSELAAVKATPNDAILADWLVAGKTLAQPIEDACELASERIKANGSITASDGTTITQKIGKGAYKVLNAIGLWATLVELLSEERRIRCMKFSMTSIKDEIAEELNVPKTGKAAVTAESVFDAKIRTHVEQGERRTFQFL